MNLKLETKINKDFEFQEIIKEMINNDTVQEMNKYRQHYDTSCYEHCYLVSYYCYKICKKLNLDYISAARAGMVHDLFLYDWRESSTTHRLHAFSHGKVAYNKAKELFEMNSTEKDIIENHMWPVTPKPPKTKEGWIITLVDKYCAVKESKDGFEKQFVKSRVFRFAMILLLVVLFRKY